MTATRFLPEGRLPCWADVERLCAVDSVAHAWMHLYRHGDLDREQLLCALALAFADIRAALMDLLLERARRDPVNLSFPAPEPDAPAVVATTARPAAGGAHDPADPVVCTECPWRGPLSETAGDPGGLARCPRCALPVLPEARLRWVKGGRPPDGQRDGRPVYLLPPEFFARRPAP